ncbi:unnamed protein product [Arctia plantaginis]|uniref:Uncharacterized protein n=1 Tax=Arctia plantaginis TaxID=874455 RepID=A0A8S1AJ98_ARCPL|nr:unnamed protein product [Arctia plantaginis]
MPINRSPPLTATTKLSLTTPVLAPLQHSSSVPNIASEDREKRPECDIPNITQRNKRKCLDLDLDTQHDNQISVFMSEMKTMFLEFKEQQDKKIEKIYTSIEEIKAQNVTIQSTVTFLSQNYDALQDRINQLETQLVTERETNLLHLQKLEDNLEKMERGARSTCVEIRNIPVKPQESKESLAAMVTRIVPDTVRRSLMFGRFTGGTVSISRPQGARTVFSALAHSALALQWSQCERALAPDSAGDGHPLTSGALTDCATPIVPWFKKEGNIKF